MDIKEEYSALMAEILADPKVQSMSGNRHHIGYNTLEHVIHVTNTAYKLSRALHMNVDVQALVRGGMLHDFYLYDYSKEKNNISAYRHGTGHADIALKNAKERYDLSPVEQDIIYSHMWPLNITRVPKYKESRLISAADKYCATVEVFRSLPVLFKRKMNMR